MATDPRKSTRPRGRPSREDEVRRALAEIGVDPTMIDPLRVLASIAGDVDAPAGARVAACRTLLGVKDHDPAEASSGDASINARAVAMMRRTN